MKLQLILPILTILIVGCSSKPYAIIDGSQSKITDDNSHDIVITGVDGKMLFDGMKTRKIDPGFHYTQLTSVKSGRRGDVTYQPWSLNAEPCKRYVIAAKHSKDKKFSNKYWDVELLRIEPILHCEELVREQEKKSEEK